MNVDLPSQHVPQPRAVAPHTRRGPAFRSRAFVAVFACYLLGFIGLGQRLVLWPAIVLFPRRRAALVGAWLRAHARAIVAMGRWIAGIHISVRGAIPAASCIVVMNHQSVLDIPIGLSLIPGPQTLIPTRTRYRRGIPGISPLVRLAGFPFVSQGRTLTRAEHQALAHAADLVAAGERSMLIFPEGHRTLDGRIGRFMRGGLRIVFARARQPVYCVVVDGMTQARTTADALRHLAGASIAVTILGPFTPPRLPPDAPSADAAVDLFIEFLHQQMVDELTRMRAPASDGVANAAQIIDTTR